MTAATTYANALSSLFSLFLSVVFGALAFAAAIPLSAIGKKWLSFSSSSLLIAGVLCAFFIISFLTFLDTENNLRIVLAELSMEIEKSWTFSNPDTLSAFQPNPPAIGDWSLSSIGYLIGSIGTLIAFLWISNADRKTAK